VDLQAAALLPCPIATAKAELETLDGYPSWLGIVTRVTPTEPLDGDRGPAWRVELGGGLGPVRLRKRVRMVRTAVEDRHIRYERNEVDGKDHSAWILEVALTASTPTTTEVIVALHYGGTLPPLVDRILAVEIGRAGSRLAKRIAAVG
jgi:hypothetical protein